MRATSSASASLRNALRLALPVRQLLGQFGVDEARRDRIDGDADLSDFARQRAGEAGRRGLGGAVHGEAVIAGRGDDRADLDDAALAIGQHVTHDIFGQDHRREHVEAHQPPQFRMRRWLMLAALGMPVVPEV